MGKQAIIEHDEYQGNPIVVIRWDIEGMAKYPFSFGLGKAKLLRQALRQDPTFLDTFIEECDG